MKVICKSNNYIAIPTKNKTELAYLLGQYVNKNTCTVEIDSDGIGKIKCIKKPSKENSFSSTISLTVELNYTVDYIILDEEGNLVNAVDKEQFEQLYAVLQDEKKE